MTFERLSLPVAVYGQKLDSNGSVAYEPLTNGIEVLKGVSGLHQTEWSYRSKFLMFMTHSQLITTIEERDAGSEADVRHTPASTASLARVDAEPDWLSRPHLRHRAETDEHFPRIPFATFEKMRESGESEEARTP